jgi:hypothetical protein
MAKLNKDALSHAKKLIKDGAIAEDRRDDWSEHAPSTADENKFIEEHGMSEYGKWHLGLEAGEDAENKGTYKFPIRDFRNVHRGAVIAAKVRAAQYDHDEVRSAADELLELIDNKEA